MKKEKKKLSPREVLSRISIALTAVFVFIFGCAMILAEFDRFLVGPMLVDAVVGCISEETNDQVIAFKEKFGGPIKGVCHAYQNLDLLQDANIEWVRIDYETSYVYDSDGNLHVYMSNLLNQVEIYNNNGTNVFCVYMSSPRTFYDETGYDFRTPEGKAALIKASQDFIRAIDGYIPIVQVCNEITMERFRTPYTLEEVVEFTGIILKAMSEVDHNVTVGVNSTMFEGYMLADMLMPYMDYIAYIGLDGYPGCFEWFTKSLYVYDVACRAVWELSGKPILITEFGYKSLGESKTEAEKQAILESYGFSSEEDAKENIMEFVYSLPEGFRETILNHIEYSSEEELAEKLFTGDNAEHLYKELPSSYYVWGCEHNPEGQAKFITQSIEHFSSMDFVCGAFIYSYIDDYRCYYCDQEDCPVETGWGLLDRGGNPKPSYYATAEAFANWN